MFSLLEKSISLIALRFACTNFFAVTNSALTLHFLKPAISFRVQTINYLTAGLFQLPIPNYRMSILIIIIDISFVK